MKKITAFILILTIACSLFGGCSDNEEMTLRDFYSLKKELSLPYEPREVKNRCEENLKVINNRLAAAYMEANEGATVIDKFIQVKGEKNIVFYAIVEHDASRVVTSVRCDSESSWELYRFLKIYYDEIDGLRQPASCPNIIFENGNFTLK